MDRRRFLTHALTGCSLAASPLLTQVSFAAAPWETRLVVIILRGGMDGLDVVRPYGDPSFAELRPNLGGGQAREVFDLDGFFALHPALKPLYPLWTKGELGFAHAVSTPYRDKRSHFDGQDVLEAGTVGLSDEGRDGWLNRLLQGIPGVQGDTALSLGWGDMLLLKGAAPVANWAPEAALTLSPQAERLMALVMEEAPQFHAVFAEAQALSEATGAPAARHRSHSARHGHTQLAEFAAKRLRAETRIAAFSLNGWDTHQNQSRGLSRALERLSDAILALQAGVGEQVWQKTTVLALTEFGRTVRENGTKGTDHGTGGLMLFAGGAVRGGRVLGAWPGLAPGDLYEGRDLMPLRDVRAYVGWALRDLTGISQTRIERDVFPRLDMGASPKLLR